VLRQSIDLYNDNQTEKLVRKVAERLEVGTIIVRRILQELTKELENHRFFLLEQQTAAPTMKEMTAREMKEAETFLKKKTCSKRPTNS